MIQFDKQSTDSVNEWIPKWIVSGACSKDAADFGPNDGADIFLADIFVRDQFTLIS